MATRAEQREAVQATIFDAAVELFEVRGYDETTVDEIAERAGVGRATFFRHFQAKVGLLRELNRRLVDDARTRLEVGPDDAVGRLAVVADAVHDAWATAGPGQRALGAEAAAGSDPTGERTHPELLALVAEIVGEGIARGELASPLPDPLAAFLVTSHLVAAVGWWIHRPDAELRPLVDGALAQALTGVRPS